MEITVNMVTEEHSVSLELISNCFYKNFTFHHKDGVLDV